MFRQNMGNERDYDLAILVILLLLFWPAALIYYYTRPFKATYYPYGPTQGPQPVPGVMESYCPNCGRKIVNVGAFCPYCGGKLI